MRWGFHGGSSFFSRRQSKTVRRFCLGSRTDGWAVGFACGGAFGHGLGEKSLGGWVARLVSWEWKKGGVLERYWFVHSHVGGR